MNDVQPTRAFASPLPEGDRLRAFAKRLGSITGLSAAQVAERLFRPGEPVAVQTLPLGGAEITLRPGTSDVMVLRDSFVGLFHLPPPGPEPRVLLDLGSNIGTTMAHFAHLYESCLVFGVELDAESVSLCKRNIEPWRDRCEVLHAAVAASDGTSGYERRAGNEWGFRIGSGSTQVRTLSLDSIVEHFALDQIDYLKMDVEGAEAEILRAGGDWPERVRVLKVEVHRPYTVDEALDDLLALGFSCERDERHKACLVARRSAAE